LSLCTMNKVVKELVYFPHYVFVHRTTTLRSSSKLLYSLCSYQWIFTFLCACSDGSNLADYVTRANNKIKYLLVIMRLYHVNSQ